MLFSGQMFCQVFCTLPCLRPPFMVNPALLFGLTYRTVNLFHVRQACKCSSGLLHMSLCIYYSSALFSSKPSSFSFAKTSSNDLRPRLRTFIISSEVLFVNSSTVLIRLKNYATRLLTIWWRFVIWAANLSKKYRQKSASWVSISDPVRSKANSEMGLCSRWTPVGSKSYIAFYKLESSVGGKSKRHVRS